MEENALRGGFILARSPSRTHFVLPLVHFYLSDKEILFLSRGVGGGSWNFRIANPVLLKLDLQVFKESYPE